jgi:tetratricopeptide (TPR) repeat protein
MDVSLLKTQWDAFSSNPVPAMIFIAVAASSAWWLKSHIDKEQIEALKAKHAVLEERARLAADKVPLTEDKSLETDDKGNVKPPEKPSAPETPTDEQHPEPSEFSLFLQMQYAYLEEGDCLPKVTAYYDKLKSSPRGLIHPQQIDAEYLLSRFRCGSSSAVDTLKAQGGPTVESFFANAVLADYYQSIGENHAALKYFQYNFDHAPDSTRKFNSAISLGEFRAEIGEVTDGISFLKGQISYFQTSNDQAALWQVIGRIYESKGLHWQKQLCFEQSLKLNPDNTALRFALAYSYGERRYGKAMARHHYEILLQQTPLNSTVSNNLSVIYDEMGAVTTKISLLRGAQRSAGKTAPMSAQIWQQPTRKPGSSEMRESVLSRCPSASSKKVSYRQPTER